MEKRSLQIRKLCGHLFWGVVLASVVTACSHRVDPMAARVYDSRAIPIYGAAGVQIYAMPSAGGAPMFAARNTFQPLGGGVPVFMSRNAFQPAGGRTPGFVAKNSFQPLGGPAPVFVGRNAQVPSMRGFVPFGGAAVGPAARPAPLVLSSNGLRRSMLASGGPTHFLVKQSPPPAGRPLMRMRRSSVLARQPLVASNQPAIMARPMRMAFQRPYNPQIGLPPEPVLPGRQAGVRVPFFAETTPVRNPHVAVVQYPKVRALQAESVLGVEGPSPQTAAMWRVQDEVFRLLMEEQELSPVELLPLLIEEQDLSS